MVARITEKMIENRIDALNKTADRPSSPCVAAPTRTIWAIGNFHLSCQCGGYSLHEVVCENGSTRDVFGCGHVTKRDLFNRLCAYHAGRYEQKGD